VLEAASAIAAKTMGVGSAAVVRLERAPEIFSRAVAVSVGRPRRDRILPGGTLFVRSVDIGGAENAAYSAYPRQRVISFIMRTGRVYQIGCAASHFDQRPWEGSSCARSF